ncbi:MAG: LCP family protein, partial [Acidimicrobiia bacterium]|nr:LCP family protein [Acidimicrobiia bacterium]
MSAHKLPSAWGAGFRSMILPGWGQLATRHRAMGWVLICATLLSGAVFFLIVSGAGLVAIAWLVEPEMLLVLMAINLVTAAIRLLATGHAWTAGGGSRLFPAMALATMVLAPHFAVGWMAIEVQRTVQSVFVDTPAPRPLAQAALSGTAAPNPASPLLPTESTQVTLATGEAVYYPPLPIPSVPFGFDPFDGKRINVLILGGDAGPGRSGLRTDTMIVASIDTGSGDTSMFGIPRNYGGFTFSDGTPYPGSILNSVYGWGERNPQAFGGIDPGASALRDVIEHLTGLTIHNFVLVDLTGFADVVDALGGVTMPVPKPVFGPLYDPVSGEYEMIRIPSGTQTLTGGEALAYARSRYGSSDYARMSRQRCILSALAGQSDAAGLFRALPRLLEVTRQHVTTDIPVEMIRDLIRVVPKVDADKIRVIGFDASWRSGRTAEG